jgi:tetratricopeptide (TPR) repeat protein
MAMANVLKNLSQIYEYRHRVTGLIAIECIVFPFLVGSDNQFEKLIPEADRRWAIYFLVLLLVAALWMLFRVRLPKCKKGRLGIVISIVTESDKQENLCRNGFLHELERQINLDKMKNYVTVFSLQGYKAEWIIKVVNDHTEAKNAKMEAELNNGEYDRALDKDIAKWNKLSKRNRWGMCIWGRIREGKSQGNNAYGLELDCLVNTIPMSIARNIEFSKDMLGAFHRKIQIDEREELQWFPLAGRLMYYPIKYILGMVAVVSGQECIAIKQFRDLEKEIAKAPNSSLPSMQHMKKRIPFWLSEAQTFRAFSLELVGKIDEAIAELEEAVKLNPNNYACMLLLGRVYFAKGNMEQAFEAIEKARSLSKGDHSCLYSLAFLFIYEGKNYKKALTIYRKAIEATPDAEDPIVKDIIVFIENVLNKEPDKIQLHFALGFIKYELQNNISDSRKHFECFVDRAVQENRYDKLINKASEYISEIKRVK